MWSCLAGVCAKWGIGYDDVAAQNPGVIYASLTGFGQTGPWADRRAYAVVSHAVGGLTHQQLEHQETVAGGALLANDAFSHGDVYTGERPSPYVSQPPIEVPCAAPGDPALLVAPPSGQPEPKAAPEFVTAPLNA